MKYALESAAELDAERAAGKVKGGLHGIPIVSFIPLYESTR